jgi:error-prone DNA polymerase
MGLRYVKSLGEDDWQRIRRTREERPFASLADFAHRARLDIGSMSRLAEAGAFCCFGLDRRQALWQAKGLARERRDGLPIERDDRSPGFRGLGTFETIAWDYTAAGHSTVGHPLGPLRDQLAGMGLPDAAAVLAMRDGRRARYAGMVICRQRPSTARGVVFMTLEDETGFVNLVVWRDVFKRYEVIAKTSAFLGVTGRIQSQDGVTHLIADELWVPRLNLEPATVGSRDFH